MKIKVVYSPKVVAESGSKVSPSAVKPRLFAEYLQNSEYKDIIEFVEPEAVTVEDICRCHDKQYVEDILSLKEPNGFGTKSQSVVDSLPWTNGAMYTAAKLAYQTKQPTVAIVAGFHHAGYAGFEQLGYFCTFNGLMIAAMKLVAEDGLKKVSIVDCDMHWGNGTDDILDKLKPSNIANISFGKYFGPYSSAENYLLYFSSVKTQLQWFKPDVIIYQSGADVHIDDPFGGLLTEDQMYERDVKMFQIAKELDIPITWTLAGGYQKDKDGGCSYVLKLHANTFKAYQEVYK
jgi:acetoin utilization deacetylase AcuC-like enzyme